MKQSTPKDKFKGEEKEMGAHNCATKDGLSDLQILVFELEKLHPDLKVIKTLTSKYGIPYKSSIPEQLDELLIFLNSLSISPGTEPNQEP